MKLRPLFRVHDALTRYSGHLAALLVAAVATLYCLDVFARYLFNAPLYGVSAIGAYLLSTTVCLSVPLVTREGSHITIALLQEYMRPETAKRYSRVISALGGLVCLIVAGVTLSESHRQFANDILTESEVLFPKWIVSVFVPYCFLSTGLYLLRHSCGAIDHD